ncbi:8598_t:CDS:1, partial [Dentiscutata erythropus]
LPAKVSCYLINLVKPPAFIIWPSMSIIVLDFAIEYFIADSAKLIEDTYFKCLIPYILLITTAYLKSFSPL